MEKAVFGAKKFFSQQAFISGIRGVEGIRYEYSEVKALEVVEIWFNPWKVSYNELLELFYDLHDPTVNEQNQSVIFFSNVNQLKVAKNKKRELNQKYKGKIITEITPIVEYRGDLTYEKLIS